MILENFGDIPFFPDVVPPHTVAFLSVLAREVRRLQMFRSGLTFCAMTASVLSELRPPLEPNSSASMFLQARGSRIRA